MRYLGEYVIPIAAIILALVAELWPELREVVRLVKRALKERRERTW